MVAAAIVSVATFNASGITGLAEPVYQRAQQVQSECAGDIIQFSRIAGFYSYILDQTDLLFPKNSGWRMKLYRVDSIAALKQKAWNQASETKIGDMICDARSNLRALFSSLAPTWVRIRA